MKLSVIIPCHPRNLPTLPRTLESLDAAASGLDVEKIVIRDDESRGLSWARNQGLAKATGEAVFFVDADDTVKSGYFSVLSLLLERTGADFVISSTDYAPLKRDYNLSGNAAIREVMMPAFFGYSFDDVRRWNSGGALSERREQGGVWRCAFRRSFLDQWNIRFDENLRLFEDSPFIAECAARAEKIASTDERVYEYVSNPDGLMASSMKDGRYWTYKFAALENRKAIAARVGEEVMEYFSASVVFTALEFLKACRFGDFFRYFSDPFVRGSFWGFPWSISTILKGARR